jgi:hypothetical protein
MGVVFEFSHYLGTKLILIPHMLKTFDVWTLVRVEM